MDRIEIAVQSFREGHSCSQAVFLAFCDKFGLDKETALKLAAGFGGGMGMGDMCGAATGAYMALGITFGIGDPDAKDKIHALTREFAEKFKQEKKSLMCRDLLGCEICTPQGKEFATDNNLRVVVCEDLVRHAASIADEFLRRADK